MDVVGGESPGHRTSEREIRNVRLSVIFSLMAVLSGMTYFEPHWWQWAFYWTAAGDWLGWLLVIYASAAFLSLSPRLGAGFAGGVALAVLVLAVPALLMLVIFSGFAQSMKELWALPAYAGFVILQALLLITSLRAYRATRPKPQHSAADMGVPAWAESLDAGWMMWIVAFALTLAVVVKIL